MQIAFVSHEPVRLDDMPKYDLFLSQVIDFLNEYFPEERFTGNMIQNYIKSEVITKPYQSKKRGYSRMHLIQLVFLCYMRPVLTTDEIKRVFSLAFNEINKPEDDFITWEEAYELFLLIYQAAREAEEGIPDCTEDQIDHYLDGLSIQKAGQEQIRRFIKVLILVTRASEIKRRVQTIIGSLGPAAEPARVDPE